MLSAQVFSPRKPQKFILKIKPNPPIRSPTKPPASQAPHPLPSKLHSFSQTQTCSRSPSLRRSCKDKKEVVNICSSSTVCAFARNPSASGRIGGKMGLYDEQVINFINDQVFMASNSPRKRGYRICPKSSYGFRQAETKQAKRGVLTEESRKSSNLTFQPWQSQLDRHDLDEMWG